MNFHLLCALMASVKASIGGPPVQLYELTTSHQLTRSGLAGFKGLVRRGGL